jgi:hypothetical protein
MSKPRGRPPKFGRPSRLVALTLPEDVLARLKTIHPDAAWAIVRLVEGHDADGNGESARVDIALFSGRRGLIVVDRDAFNRLPDVALIPLSESRAFLALGPGMGLADLELAVIDRIDEATDPSEQAALMELRSRLREWRADPEWAFEPRAIIVAERRVPPAGGRRRGDGR